MARSLTLLEICTQAAEGTPGINVPTTIFANSDPDAASLKRAAIRTGRELAAKIRWQALLSAAPYTFSTVASTSNYSLPTDYGHFAHLTQWDSSNLWEILGPATPQIWQGLQNSNTGSTSRYWFRIAGNYFQLYPTPTTAGTISYNYYSRYYSTTSGGTAQEDFAADTDLCRIDAELFILGVAYYFRRSKELPYADDRADYMAGILDYQSNDTPKARVDFGANTGVRDSSAYTVTNIVSAEADSDTITADLE